MTSPSDRRDDSPAKHEDSSVYGVLAVTGGVTVRPLDDGQLGHAVQFLNDAEATAGLPLVDESERERISALLEGGARSSRWVSVVAVRDDAIVGYASLVRDAGRADATGDVAVSSRHEPTEPVLAALLVALTEVASHADVRQLDVWMRHATENDLVAANEAGFGIRRRLGVLGRQLDESIEVPSVPGVVVRSYRPERDDESVVGVLAAAYEGTDDGGWDLERFRERRSWSWFAPQDLLLAVDDDGDVLGLHWLKRRSGTVGEVYNLAVHPGAQGRRLGQLLLQAGLEHLREHGCDEVMLWVDLANTRAVELYSSQGFSVLWQDVAFTRDVAPRE